LVVLLTSVRTERDIRLVVVAIVAGTLFSVLIGLAAGGLGEAGAGVETATATEGRLQGGADDPNFLASAIVPAVVLAVALAGLVRARQRPALLAAIVVLVVGLVATQSRGGALAAIAALLASLVVMRGRRGHVLAVVALVAAVALAYVAVSPGALSRLTSAEDRGNGREDLWVVASRMADEHPVTGVGLDNFRVRSAEYVREPGSLQFVDLIAERPHEVHNTYLQLLAETGVVGAALFVAVVALALRSAGTAARRLAAAGRRELAQLARAVLVANVGLLAAGVFLSTGSRALFWILLALGPALLGLAPPVAPRARG
jgi:O-antigen ligase